MSDYQAQLTENSLVIHQEMARQPLTIYAIKGNIDIILQGIEDDLALRLIWIIEKGDIPNVSINF